MPNLYTGATQLGIQHQHQSQIQPPQLPQPSSYSSGQGIMSMSMTGQQPPQPQGQNIPSNMQNTHTLPHQLPHGHLQPQRGVMITPQHPHQQTRGFPPGGPVGPGPGQGLMQNPASNPNPNAPSAPGMYPHGPPPPPPQGGARRIPGGPPGQGPSNPPPPSSVMGGMMGVQMPMQPHPHQTHSHMPQHGIPPNQQPQLPPHLTSHQQPPQQPPHLTHQQGQQQPPHLPQQNVNVNMNINNPLQQQQQHQQHQQHPPLASGQPQSNPGLPPGITGQLRQGGPNARMLGNNGPQPPGAGGGGGGGGQGGSVGDMGMGSMGIPASMGMGGLGMPVGMGRGGQHQPQLGAQNMMGGGVNMMGRGGGGGGPAASGMAMMNLGMGIPQPQGQSQGHPAGVGAGIPHRAQPQQHQPPSSQGQPFGLGPQQQQQRPPSSQQQPPHSNPGNPQQLSHQQATLSYNPAAHLQQQPSHGNIHTPGPPNPGGNPNPNPAHNAGGGGGGMGASSPGRPPTGTPGTPGRGGVGGGMPVMGALRAQAQQVGQTAANQPQGQMQQRPTTAGNTDLLNSFAQLSQQQHQQHQQQRQMMAGMTAMGEFGGAGGPGSSTGAGAGGHVGMQHSSSGGGFFIPDPHAHASNFPGGGPNITSAGAHNQMSNANQPGGLPSNSSPFTTIPHPPPGQLHHPQGHPHSHPGSVVGLGPGAMHLGQQISPQQQQHQQSPHPPTPHRGTPTPGHPPGVQVQHQGGPHARPHPSQPHGPHGQLLQGHGPLHSQLSGTPGSGGPIPNSNPNAPTTAPGNAMGGSGPSSVMIPHPNAGGPGPSNAPGGPAVGRNPANRVVGMGGNMGMPMNMGMMFGGPVPSPEHGEGQARVQTPNVNNPNQGRLTPASSALPINQSPRQGQHVPAPGQSLPNRPPSRHPPNLGPHVVPHPAQSGGAGQVGMGRGAPGGPLPMPNAGPGPHVAGGGVPNAAGSNTTSPQIRRTSLPPGVVAEGSAVVPPSGAPTASPAGLPPHGVLVRPPIQYPSVVGVGQGLVRVMGFSGAMGAESEERLTRNHWNKLVNEYFAPHSSWKLTLWKDNDRKEAKLFEISPDVIAMFFVVSSQAGVKSMNLLLDNVHERPIQWGVSMVECPEARWIWRFTDGHMVVLKGAFSAQVTAYHNPAAAVAGTNAMNGPNGPPGPNVTNGPTNGVNGPTPGTPGSVGTPHSPQAHPPAPGQPPAPPLPNQPHPQSHYILKFDSMAFDSFVHDKLLDLSCILGPRITYSYSSLALGVGSANTSLTGSPHTQGHKTTTPSTTTQGSPDIAPASTSSNGSNPSSGPGPANVKTEEQQGQNLNVMSQGQQQMQLYPQGQATQSPGNMSGGGGAGGVPVDEPLVIEQAILPAEPINAFGIPQASMRCLELAESVGHMTELIRFCRESKMGPTEGLQALANHIKAQYGLGHGQLSVMGGSGSPAGMVSGPGVMTGNQEGRNAGSSSLGPGGGQGQSPHPYGIPPGMYGPPPSQFVGAPPAPPHGQGPGQGQPQPHAQQFQSQSQAHTPQSAQHTPQLAQLTKPLGQLTPQSQNQIIQNSTVTGSPGQIPAQPPAPSKGTSNPGGGGNQGTKPGGTTNVGNASGSTAMKRKAPDTSTPAMTQNDPSLPPAKRVTRRKSKAG